MRCCHSLTHLTASEIIVEQQQQQKNWIRNRKRVRVRARALPQIDFISNLVMKKNNNVLPVARDVVTENAMHRCRSHTLAHKQTFRDRFSVLINYIIIKCNRFSHSQLTLKSNWKSSMIFCVATSTSTPIATNHLQTSFLFFALAVVGQRSRPPTDRRCTQTVYSQTATNFVWCWNQNKWTAERSWNRIIFAQSLLSIAVRMKKFNSIFEFDAIEWERFWPHPIYGTSFD